jgi:hypothetical protein
MNTGIRFGQLALHFPVPEQVIDPNQADPELVAISSDIFRQYVTPESLENQQWEIQTTPQDPNPDQFTLYYTGTDEDERALGQAMFDQFGVSHDITPNRPDSYPSNNENRLPLVQAMIEIYRQHFSMANMIDSFFDDGVKDIDVSNPDTELNQKGLVPFYKLFIRQVIDGFEQMGTQEEKAPDA